MKFTPSLIQIQNIKENFTADMRPSNKFFIKSLVVYKKIFIFFKFFLNYFNDYIIFSNILLSSKYSNLYLKNKNNSYAEIYSKKTNIINILKIKQKKIFKFLRENNIIYPFYKNLFPGYGADYHYFGTIPISKERKKILSVNEKCQLNNHKNIYIVDGSVFNFINNKYPLGLIMANARRVAANIKK
jgi:flagellar biosynthesis/type III secretory pathway chaperone